MNRTIESEEDGARRRVVITLLRALSVVMRDCNLGPVFWEQSGSGQASADAARYGNTR